MADESPERADERAFSSLTVELIEQSAALAGERISAPIRSAGSVAARWVICALCVGATLIVALVFVGIAVGLLIGMAPETSRWWICLLVALGFLLLGALIAWIGFRRRPPAKTQS
jgi:hypothetical protein